MLIGRLVVSFSMDQSVVQKEGLRGRGNQAEDRGERGVKRQDTRGLNIGLKDEGNDEINFATRGSNDEGR